MPFTLKEVVPWGRTFDEYRRMFALTPADLAGRILGAGDGPAAFNAELSRHGGRVVSCDPLFRFSTSEIEARVADCYDEVIEQTRRNRDGFVWSADLPDVEALGRRRLGAMRDFLRDFDGGRAAERYVAGELPDLPFADADFDLALCSHFLFLYGALGLDFHLRSIRELCRVAREVRVYPLQQLDRSFSPFVEPVIEQCRSLGLEAALVPVDHEFQRGAVAMLRVRVEP